jgi:hypothetical protein
MTARDALSIYTIARTDGLCSRRASPFFAVFDGFSEMSLKTVKTVENGGKRSRRSYRATSTYRGRGT